MTIRKTATPLPVASRLLCLHAWTTEGAHHEHRCHARTSCHAAPCVCVCGGRDYCTLHRTAWVNGLPQYHVTEPPERGT